MGMATTGMVIMVTAGITEVGIMEEEVSTLATEAVAEVMVAEAEVTAATVKTSRADFCSLSRLSVKGCFL